MKSYVKSIIPPIILGIYRKLKKNRYGWYGNYKAWEEAKKECTGYEKDEILQKVRCASLKVKKGEAIYERDGVLFDKIEYSWPLLAGLMFAAAKLDELRVLDFGGSLGTTYYQNRKFLNELKNVSWSIVEQKHFVDVGRREFEDDRLKFFYTIEECMKFKQPNVLVLSSVLQYLEKPYEMLDKALKYKFDFVVLDLTPISLNKEVLTVQKVDPKIYNAQYPCWMLDMEKISCCFTNNGYSLIESFDALNNYKVFTVDGKLIGKYVGAIYMKKQEI